MRRADPSDCGDQLCDRGGRYTTTVFVLNDEQKAIADASRAELNTSKVLRDPVVTPIRAASNFYLAEDHHQDYHAKNPYRY